MPVSPADLGFIFKYGCGPNWPGRMAAPLAFEFLVVMICDILNGI